LEKRLVKLWICLGTTKTGKKTEEGKRNKGAGTGGPKKTRGMGSNFPHQPSQPCFELKGVEVWGQNCGNDAGPCWGGLRED